MPTLTLIEAAFFLKDFGDAGMSKQSGLIRLLPRDALIKTGPFDEADWTYKPFLGWIISQRYRLILSLLPKHRVHRILEVGYGSGIFMPELARHCDELYGIDIHPHQQSVTDILARFGVTAQLISGTVEAVPFSENFFDCVVALSSLEFVENFQAACQEMKRVLKSDGCLVIVTPGASPIVDLGLKILTGEDAQENYGDRRKFLIPTLKQFFTLNKKLTFPAFGSWLVCLYKAFKLFPIHQTAKDNIIDDQFYQI